MKGMVNDMQKSITRDMTNGSPAKLILKFSFPMLLGNLFQQLYNMVDSIVVGKFVGKDALAAVGATGSLGFLIIGLAFGLAAGVSIVISQYFGAKDYDNVRKGFATATYIIIGSALIMGIIGFFSCRTLLEILNTPESIIDQSELYLKITFAGILGVSCYNGMSAVLRALGDSVTPLIFLAVASILNVVLDLLFVVVFHWDVPGVAIATIISQFVSAIGCIVYAMARVKILRIPLHEFKPDKTIFKKCIKLGIPVALQNSFVSISMTALQWVINGYEEVVIAANTVVLRIEQLVLQPGMSVGAALAAYAGQNVGAGRIDRARSGYKWASIIIIIFSVIMLPVMYFGGGLLMDLFTKKEDVDVVIIGIKAIRITCFFYSAVGMIFVSRNFLSGTGDIRIPMVMGFVEVICRVFFAVVLPNFIGFYGIWWSTALTWVFTAIVGIVREWTGIWKTKSIVQP
ncbi:MATE family efflux transporter [Variimorphobacter saccharofermentans]|nr:MATE family efflux transporter [Variimorphobacter saccharofermentans]